MKAVWNYLVRNFTASAPSDPTGTTSGAAQVDTRPVEHALRARTLVYVQVLLFGLVAVVAVTMLVMGNLRTMVVMSLSLLPCLGSVALSRRGKVQPAGFLLALAMVIVITLVIVVGQGIHDIGTTGYVLILVIAGVLLERRNYFIIVALSIIAVLAVILAEISGLLVNPFSERTDISDLVVVSAILLIVAGVMRRLAGDWVAALQQVQRVNLRQAALIDETHRRAEHLSLLNRAAVAASAGLDLGQVVYALYGALREVVQADTFYVALYDAPTRRILFPFYSSPQGLVDAGSANMDDQPGLTGEVIRLQRTLYLTDLLDPQITAAHQIIFVGPDRSRSYLGIPLLAKGQVIGVLSVQSGEPDAYTPEQIALLETVGSQAASAIENARLYTALQEELAERQRAAQALHQREAILEAMTFAAEVFLSDPDWRLGIECVLGRLGQAVGSSRVYLYENRPAPPGDSAVIWASLLCEWAAPGVAPLAGNPAYALARLPEQDGESWFQTMLRNLPVTGPPDDYDAGVERGSDLDDVYWGARSYLDMPIFVDEGEDEALLEEGARKLEYWWGFLGFAEVEHARIWSQTEIDTLRVAASLLAAAIQRQQADQEIRQLNDDLEQRVRQRTIDLEVSNQELQTFAYSVAHDLKAPLRGIDGYSKLLLDDHAGQLDQEGLFYLGNVRRAAQFMGRLIEDLLHLSRVTRAEMHLETVDLSDMALRILNEIAQREPERDLEMAVQPGLEVRGDASLLRLALMNLLSNAWKFTARCAPARIRVGMERKYDRSIYFVQDNGVGFDMKYADKLFGTFQRLHAPAEYEGTGIGLATVQRVIQRHGGEIWAEGEVDKGATFYFTLG